LASTMLEESKVRNRTARKEEKRERQKKVIIAVWTMVRLGLYSHAFVVTVSAPEWHRRTCLQGV
jgi:hypothetical protein